MRTPEQQMAATGRALVFALAMLITSVGVWIAFGFAFALIALGLPVAAFALWDAMVDPTRLTSRAGLYMGQRGETGPPGPPGPMGMTGAQGERGPMGPAGVDR